MPKTESVDEKTQENEAADQTDAQAVEYEEVSPETTGKDAAGINVLLDITMPVTVSIGKTELPVQQLLTMGPGSVIPLDKPIDAPVDLYIKDHKFATAMVVVINDRFAVKIKDIAGLPEQTK